MGRRPSPTPTQTCWPIRPVSFYNTCSFDHGLWWWKWGWWWCFGAASFHEWFPNFALKSDFIAGDGISRFYSWKIHTSCLLLPQPTDEMQYPLKPFQPHKLSKMRQNSELSKLSFFSHFQCNSLSHQSKSIGRCAPQHQNLFQSTLSSSIILSLPVSYHQSKISQQSHFPINIIVHRIPIHHFSLEGK